MIQFRSVTHLARALALVSIAASSVAACSSSKSEDPGPVEGAGGGDPTGFCETEDDSPDFHANMSMAGTTKFDVTLVDASPVLPVEGRNSWTIEVKDLDGNLVEGAKVSLTCAMPGHTHGCAVIPTVTDLGGGQYKLEPIIFNMPKRWNLSFKVAVPSADGKTTDTDYAQLAVCI